MRISDWSSDVCSSDLWNQGDGACFEGNYSYARGASAAIRRYAPKDVELQRIADALGAIQRRNFYQRSEEHASELQSLMRISYAVFCLTKKRRTHTYITTIKITQVFALFIKRHID